MADWRYARRVAVAVLLPLVAALAGGKPVNAQGASGPPLFPLAPTTPPQVPVIPADTPGMAEYLAALKVYDAAVEAREADKKAPPETLDPQFKGALEGFERAAAKAEHPKLKVECLYRVWRCHVWLRDEAGTQKAWEAFGAQLQGTADAKEREELIRWLLTRRRTRADWEGAVKLLEWVAATHPGTHLERWAKDELAWTLFLPLNEYPKAMSVCEEILKRWPDGDEARRAHYRLGMIWRCFFEYRLRHFEDVTYSDEEKLRAKEHFEVVAARWPGSLEARVSKVQLDDIALLLSGAKRIRVVPAQRRAAPEEQPQ